MQTPIDLTRAQKRRSLIIWVISAALLAGFVGALALVCSGMVAFLMNPFPGTDLKHTDFATNQEQIDVLNQILPITLPNSTTVKSFHFTKGIDYHLDFNGTLPIDEVDSFIRSLPTLEEIGKDHFKGSIDYVYIEIQIDRDSGEIVIECFTT